MKKNLIVILAIFLVLAVSSCSKRIDSTEKLAQEIADRYNGKWFKQIKFSQTTTFYQNDTVFKTESWLEEYIYPSQLMIKVNHENSNDGQLYRNDSIYIFENNVITYQEKGKHDLLILSMDIYSMSKDEIMSRLSGLDYDLSKFHETTYNNRKIYIIGAEKGDSMSNQLWYDAENLYFLKMIKNTEYGFQEVLFKDYINIDGMGWIEQEIEFKINGEIYLKEKYYNIEIPEQRKKEITVTDFQKINISLVNPVEYIFKNSIINQGVEVFYLVFQKIL